MATKVPNHTVLSVARDVRHALFPSRSAALFVLAVEVAAELLQVPVAAHVAVAVVAHVAIAVAHSRR